MAIEGIGSARKAVGAGSPGVGENDIHGLIAHHGEVDHLVVLRDKIDGAGTSVSDTQLCLEEGGDRIRLLLERNNASAVDDLCNLVLERGL